MFVMIWRSNLLKNFVTIQAYLERQNYLGQNNCPNDEPQPKRKSKAHAKTRTRKVFLCGTFAALRLCVKVFAFFATIRLLMD